MLKFKLDNNQINGGRFMTSRNAKCDPFGSQKKSNIGLNRIIT